MNGDNVSKRTDTITAPVSEDDIASDNIRQKKSSKSHNNKGDNVNHEASSKVADLNGLGLTIADGMGYTIGTGAVLLVKTGDGG